MPSKNSGQARQADLVGVIAQFFNFEVQNERTPNILRPATVAGCGGHDQSLPAPSQLKRAPHCDTTTAGQVKTCSTSLCPNLEACLSSREQQMGVFQQQRAAFLDGIMRS